MGNHWSLHGLESVKGDALIVDTLLARTTTSLVVLREILVVLLVAATPIRVAVARVSAQIQGRNVVHLALVHRVSVAAGSELAIHLTENVVRMEITVQPEIIATLLMAWVAAVQIHIVPLMWMEASR